MLGWDIYILKGDAAGETMTSYVVEDHEFEALKGRTILIFGAATGIGQATVRLAHRKTTHADASCVLSSVVLT